MCRDLLFRQGLTVAPLIRNLLFCVFLFVFVVANQARADLVMGTNLFDLNWDRGTDPNGSNTVTIPILWDGVGTDGTNNLIQAFNFGFRIEGGAAGSLAIDPDSASFPTVNPIFSSFATSKPTVSDADPGVVGMTGDNAAFSNVTVPTSGKNAVVFSFSSVNAFGTFNVYADRKLSSYYRVGAGDTAPFANAWVNDKVLLGTVNVSATAVPEPSSWLLISISMGAAAGVRRWRNRKRILTKNSAPC